MSAKSPGFAFGIEESCLLQPGLHAWWNSPTVSGSRDLTPVHLLFGNAGNCKAPVGLDHVFWRRFDQMRGNPARLFDHAVAGDGQRAAAHDSAAAAKCAGTLLNRNGIAVL